MKFESFAFEMKGVTRWGIKKQDVYLTPPELFATFEQLYNVTNLRQAFDPCPWPEAKVDGLEIEWEPITFCNPPFSKAAAWIKKAQLEAKRGVTTYMVLPWYAFYGSSACQYLLEKPDRKKFAFKFDFYSPVLRRTSKGMEVWLLEIK